MLNDALLKNKNVTAALFRLTKDRNVNTQF